MKKILAILLFTVMLAGVASAFENTGTGRTGAQLLRMNMSAHSLALGGGGMASLTGLDAFSINPAGLAQVDHMEASFSHNEMFSDVRAEYLAFAKKYFGMVFGVDLRGITFSIDERDNTGLETGESIRFYNVAGSFGVGIPVSKNFFIGGSVSGIYENAGCEGYDDFNWGVNGGLKIMLMDEQVKLAASVRNVSTSRIGYTGLRDFPMPLTGNVGLSYTFRNGEMKDKLVLVADIEGYWEQKYTPSAGIEYLWTDWLSVRAGYRHRENYDIMDCISFGFGVREKIKKINGHLDYAYAPYGDLGATHRISYGLSW